MIPIDLRQLFKHSHHLISKGYIAPVVDSHRNKTILLYNRRFVEVWSTESYDNGHTWSDPVNRTSLAGIALGPPGGVQINSGRLVVAAHDGNGTFSIFSDDGGKIKNRLKILQILSLVYMLPGFFRCKLVFR